MVTTASQQAGSVHRTDIEGLRGIAVLAVLGVHAWPDLLRGGFVGVDVFFVLSGYLVSGLVIEAMANGQFSLGHFYQRRALRLFPALCTVLLACLLAGVFTFPSEARQIGKHVAATAVFASNIALWQEAGYFDVSSESKPLLHLWSLGIEEQFYLLWPIAAWVMLRRPRHAFVMVLALCAASFALNAIWVVPKAKATFFLLPMRAWELLVGSALSVAQAHGISTPGLQRLRPLLRSQRTSAHLANVKAVAGAVLIGLSLALLDKQSVFPGWWALLPTLGTLFLLSAGPEAWLNQRVLGHPILLFYGRISYPLYLWHWPLLVFPMLLGVEMTNAVRVAVITASVGLAALTTDYIEFPMRQKGGRRQAWALAGALATLGALGLALNLSDGLLGSYPPQVQAIARAELAQDFSGYRSRRCFLDLEQGPLALASECWPSPEVDRRLTLLWGDSHAAALYPGLSQVTHALGDGQMLAQATKARCPPTGNVPSQSSHDCQAVNTHVLQRIAKQVPDTVVLGGYWALYSEDEAEKARLLEGLRATVTVLTQMGVRHIVVIGQMPTWTSPLPKVLLRIWGREGNVPERTFAGLDGRLTKLDDELRVALRNTQAVFVSPLQRMCNTEGCLASQTRDGLTLPLVLDESHLTEAGSVELVQRVRAELLF